MASATATEGSRFKEAMRDLARAAWRHRAGRRASRSVRRSALRDIVAATLEAAASRPHHPAPRAERMVIPERLRPLVVEQFKEAMAYPEIDVPMYKPLVDISTELFLPNLNLIEPNSVTLLETNQRFLES